MRFTRLVLNFWFEARMPCYRQKCLVRCQFSSEQTPKKLGRFRFHFLTSYIFTFVITAEFRLLLSSVDQEIHHLGRHTHTNTRCGLPNFMKAGLFVCSPMNCHSRALSWLPIAHSLRRQHRPPTRWLDRR